MSKEEKNKEEYVPSGLRAPRPVKGENLDTFMVRCKPVVGALGYSPAMQDYCCLVSWDCWVNDEPFPPLPGGDQGGDDQVRKDEQWPKIPLGPTSGDPGQLSASTRELYMLDVDCDKAISFINESTDLKDDKPEPNKFTAIALKGDQFYKGKFLSFAEMSKAHKGMDGKLHDINHWGTSYPIDGHPNIEYFIGYQKNTTIDPVGKTMKTDIIINPKARHYQDWKTYVDMCKEAGNKPNVSVSFWASNKKMKAKELPMGTDYTQEGYQADDDVPVLYDIGFQALSTVFKGACDDKAGCGIGLSNYAEEELRLKNENMRLKISKEEKTL